MAKYDVLMCYTSYDMYRVVVEADSREDAEAKAEKLWAEHGGGGPFVRCPEEDDGDGAMVIDCDEVEETTE